MNHSEANRRDVQFSSLQEFLTELSIDHGKIQDGVVRCCVVRQKRNDGVADVFLRAGFIVDGSKRHVDEQCGEQWLGGGGEDDSGAAWDAIRSACESLGVELRGGEFV